jgi:predicted nucleic acid-binding Zn ribbon protein
MKDELKRHLPTALDVLQKMLEKGNSPLAQDFKRYQLKLDWEKVVGLTISQRCSPVGFAGGILYIWVINASWMNQLTFVRKELLKKINDYSGKKWVREVRFTQDRREVPLEARSSDQV